MGSKDPVVQGYARAIFAVAEAEDALAQVEEELFRFARALESSNDLRDALIDAAVPADRKKAVLADLLGDRAHPQTVRLLGFIIEQGRARELGKIVDALLRTTAESREHALAEVRTAVPLSDDQKARLQEALSKATGRTVELKVLVDPSVVGGVVAHVGDQVFDGSIRTRLQEAKEQLGSV
jgi:F-type H+-transporting ATPase subunit delta